MLKSFLLFAMVAVAATSAAAMGGAPAASPDKPPVLTPDFAQAPAPPAPDPAAAPVSLTDSQAFDARPAPEVYQDEITKARRTLASAVSAEKFMDGAAAVFVAYLLYLVVF